MTASRPPLGARDLAREILSQKRFQVAVPSTHRTLWEMFWDWLRGLWSRVWDALFSHVHIGSRASTILGDALAVALIAVVVIVLVRLALGSIRDARRPDGAHALPELPDPGALYDSSREAAARGDYRMAVALLFAAAIRRLERLGIAREDPSRTVNEWRRTLRGRQPSVLPAFDAIARPFVAAFYAETPVARGAWMEAHDAYVALPVELTRA
ncbi:MAG TPA: DUF4129 domain-containing protein [Candidatus Rubrimentiphilum sp.]|nr:DUF4129 domain-containing protein [Candidatus Rubrimentiphilum sp.]